MEKKNGMYIEEKSGGGVGADEAEESKMLERIIDKIKGHAQWIRLVYIFVMALK